MGTVTSNLGLSVDYDEFESVFLSGSGGNFIHFFLDTLMLQNFDQDILRVVVSLLSMEIHTDQTTSQSLLGAALGLDSEAWTNIDRLHPVLTLAQWSLDAGDPMTVIGSQKAESLYSIGIGDFQVPNNTTHALQSETPNSKSVTCTVLSQYDPHYCIYRELSGTDSFRSWLTEPVIGDKLK